MKNKFITILTLLAFAPMAFAVDLTFPNDKLRLGKTGSGVDKILEFNLGNGSTNPKMKWSIADGQFEFSNDGTNFKALGSGNGGAGGKNYASINPDAEFGLTGWTLYQDTAGTSPINCGGTVSDGNPLTFTRTTGSPLNDSASFLLTQPNLHSVQGQGVAFAFTIDNSDKAKSLQASFNFNANSTFSASSGATGSDSDIEVYAYDVTNGNLLPISPKVITGNGGNNYTFKGTFQTSSNSSSYKLCIHGATTNANATGYQLKFDNVNIGPVVSTFASPVTDWVSFTPTFTGIGTVTSVDFKYRRVGDSVEITGRGVNGTPTGVTMSMSMPSGIVLDTTKITTLRPVGRWERSGSVGDSRYVFADPANTGTLYFNGANQGGFVTANGSALLGSGETIGVYNIVFPVAGWGSTVQMSNDTDTRVVSFKASAQPTGTLAGSFNDMIIGTVQTDTHGAYNPTTGVYTIPVSGYYDFTAGAEVDSSGASGAGTASIIRITKNGTEINRQSTALQTTWTGASTSPAVSIGGVSCVAGDTIKAQMFSSLSATVTYGATAGASYFTANRRSGPSAIAATESVNARYTTATGTAIGTSLTLIPYSTNTKDTHGGYNTSTGVYTVPVSGFYTIKAQLQTAGVTLSTVQSCLIAYYKNGSLFSYLGQTRGTGGTTQNYFISGSDNVPLLAGDQISIYALSDVATTVSTAATLNNFSILRTGN